MVIGTFYHKVYTKPTDQVLLYVQYVNCRASLKGECHNFQYFCHKPSCHWNWWKNVLKKNIHKRPWKSMFFSQLKFHSVWGSPTNKFHSMLRSPITKFNSIWRSPTTALVGLGLAGRVQWTGVGDPQIEWNLVVKDLETEWNLVVGISKLIHSVGLLKYSKYSKWSEIW